ncbi:hypothetical protein SCHPADRAFT_904442 [Schizopora paradoxa]|uniref:Uncharacterized protein n=1 Tax=Schizopora paradoxa TaxID=27342 RepID=A0A0H2RNF7_9AGAM|nr:hypothetical protein SCHPADRAFT_904442 [Schizopora paradoxa]
MAVLNNLTYGRSAGIGLIFTIRQYQQKKKVPSPLCSYSNLYPMSSYSCEVLERPGLEWPREKQLVLIHELRAPASQCFSSIPEYQCLSLTPKALDDKLIAVARRDDTGELIAFSSAIFLDIRVPQTSSDTVLHTGLTCIHPAERRSGLTISLFANLFGHLLSMFPDGIWLTSLAAIPSSLVSIYQIASDVFPSPDVPTPSPTHLAIAKSISDSHRNAMLVAPSAVFDAASFVFRVSKPTDSPMRKNVNDPALQHRNRRVNEFYRELLSGGDGDEVLQVAYLDVDKFSEVFASRYTEVTGTKIRAKL